jgi:phage terminase large subunit GpA-like protein
VRRIYAAKGSSQPGQPLLKAPSKKSLKKGIWLLIIGTDTAKDMVYSRLKIETPGPGFCHFPDGRSDEYFKQLAAEEVVTRWEKGVKKRVWKKKRARNEALDLRVYATAAMEALNPKFDKIRTNIARREAAAKKPAGRQVKSSKLKRKTGFVNRY